jgi:hypothetical protein
VQLDSSVHDAGAGDAGYVAFERLGQPGGVTGGLDRDDRVGADALLESGRGVQREEFAVIHDRDPVAEPVGLFHVVGGEQDRLPGPVQLAEQVP